MKYIVNVKGELPTTGCLSEARRLTLKDSVQMLVDEICDNYCKWPEKYGDDNELMREHCNHCPL